MANLSGLCEILLMVQNEKFSLKDLFTRLYILTYDGLMGSPRPKVIFSQSEKIVLLINFSQFTFI